jgi:transposase
MAAFAPGAVISEIDRQFDFASSMIYKWRRQAVAANRALAFVPAVVDDAASPPTVPPDPPPAPVAITVDFSAGVRVIIDATAPTALVTAALLALR